MPGIANCSVLWKTSAASYFFWSCFWRVTFWFLKKPAVLPTSNKIEQWRNESKFKFCPCCFWETNKQKVSFNTQKQRFEPKILHSTMLGVRAKFEFVQICPIQEKPILVQQPSCCGINRNRHTRTLHNQRVVFISYLVFRRGSPQGGSGSHVRERERIYR